MGRKRRKPQVIGKRSRVNYSDIVKENQRYEDYYRRIKCFPVDEFEQFLEAMRNPLPSVFRITGYKEHAKQLLRKMKENHFAGIVDVKLDQEEIGKMPAVLPWYPNELAWQTNLSRTQIRKVPELEDFHNFLITETESGHVTRQESVSMIPPLLLDVKSHHKILDLCAAPGSKTAQLIEMLHSGNAESLSEGLCIANDKDNKRCYMLVHQTSRLNSPVSLIVNHDGARFPELMIKNKEGVEVPLRYDRVLADVPCSGDGTMRKNTDVWQKWNVGNGIYLHGLQVRILQRGLELLEVGGRIVYSTCSLNPIEDEAVVSALLSKCDGSVELVDVFDELKGLQWCPGISKWEVQDRSGTWYGDFSEVPDSKQKEIRPTMFPPEMAEKYSLNRCMRLLPHYQDTGGFFVAVLAKKKALPWEKKVPCPITANVNKSESVEVHETKDKENALATEIADDSATKSPPAKKKCWGAGFKEDPFIFLGETDAEKEIVSQVKSYYSLKADFPHNQLLTRSSQSKKRHIYMVSSLVRNIITNNEKRLKLINTGVRVFSRCDNNQPNLQCHFRVTQDGCEVIEPFMGDRVIKIELDDVIKLLCEEQPAYSGLSESLRTRTEDMLPGSMLFKYTPADGEASVACELILSGWKGNNSVRAYMNKFERAHFLNLIGHEVPEEYVPNRNSRRRRAENAGDAKNGNDADANGEESKNGAVSTVPKVETGSMEGDNGTGAGSTAVKVVSD